MPIEVEAPFLHLPGAPNGATSIHNVSVYAIERVEAGHQGGALVHLTSGRAMQVPVPPSAVKKAMRAALAGVPAPFANLRQRP